jgi:hypothetical protein
MNCLILTWTVIWQIVVALNFWCSSVWSTSHSWLSTTTMCSGHLIYLLDLWGDMERGGYRRTSQLPTSFWTFMHQVWNGGELVNWPLPWTYPQGASIPVPQIFLHLVAATASYCPMKYSCHKQQWYLNSFLFSVRLWEESMRKVSFESSHLYSSSNW